MDSSFFEGVTCSSISKNLSYLVFFFLLRCAVAPERRSVAYPLVFPCYVNYFPSVYEFHEFFVKVFQGCPNFSHCTFLDVNCFLFWALKISEINIFESLAITLSADSV